MLANMARAVHSRLCFQGIVGDLGAVARCRPRTTTTRQLDPTAAPGPAIAADDSPRVRLESTK